jgi:hypothetical protein
MGVKVALGAGLAVLIGRVTAAQLFGVSATDPFTFVSAPAAASGVTPPRSNRSESLRVAVPCGFPIAFLPIPCFHP